MAKISKIYTGKTRKEMLTINKNMKPLNLAHVWGKNANQNHELTVLYIKLIKVQKMRMPNTGKDKGHLTFSYIIGGIMT